MLADLICIPRTSTLRPIHDVFLEDAPPQSRAVAMESWVLVVLRASGLYGGFRGALW